jgi:glycosyltransferase involved in cell wall biosynthesis
MPKRILFFLESLRSGGKERRFTELLYYLKKNTDYEIQVVLLENIIHYKDIFNLNVPVIIIKRVLIKKDPLIFAKFFNFIKIFKPDIIHTWGSMTTFYAIPIANFFKIPLINSQIADAIPITSKSYFEKFLWFINYNFSNIILSNSIAGVEAYKDKKKKILVIYNGVRPERFKKLKNKKSVKQRFEIKTKYAVIMVASFGLYKDHDLFVKVAESVCKLRSDVSFVAVGDGDKEQNKNYLNFVECAKEDSHKRLIFTGKISNVEELVNACDIGMLLSNIKTGEGISNSILEYMALSKPVIATDAGGICELVVNNDTGFLVNQNIALIVQHVIDLLDNSNLRKKMGEEGKKIIENKFTIDKMGFEFVKQYNNIG